MNLGEGKIMKTRLIKGALTCFALSTLVNVANASRPDEINYAPYQGKYLSIKSERDSIESTLNSQKSQLSSILSAIEDKLDYISTLESQIQEFSKRISYLHRLIPQKESEQRGAAHELSNTESAISDFERRLRSIVSELEREQRELRPIQSELVKLAQEIKRQQQRVDRLKRSENSTEREVSSLKNSVAKLKTSIQNTKREIDALKSSESSMKTKVSQLETKVSGQESKVSEFDRKSAKSKSKVARLKTRLEEQKRKLQSLKGSGASSDEISRQRVKVTSAQNSLNSAKRELQQHEQNRRSAASKQSTLKRQLSSAKTQLRSLPQKIKTKQSEIKRSQSDLKDKKSKITENESELSRLKAQIGQMMANISNMNRRHARLDNEVDRVQRRINSISSDRRRVDSELSGLEGQARETKRRISLLREELQGYREELPNLDRNIVYNRSEISEADYEVKRLRSDADTTREEIATLGIKLDRIEAETAAAYREYDSRKSLFNKYLAQAKSLGRSQTLQAKDLGNEKGLVISETISEELAKSFGDDEGRAQAELIGMVRAELDGYPAGVKEGQVSADSIEAGRIEGSRRGEQDVYSFVRQTYGPTYFEAVIKELLKLKVNGHNKRRALMSFTPNIELGASVNFDAVPDLSQSELLRSQEIETPLDPAIKNTLEKITTLKKRFVAYQSPSLSYDEPSEVPFTSVDCSAVYKGLQEFKESCEATFKSEFEQLYKKSVYNSFASVYPEQFISKYDSFEQEGREANYKTNYDKAYEVSFAKGESDGKEMAYERSYKLAYDESYSINFEPAKEVAQMEATKDGHEWIQHNPVLTVSKSYILDKELKGGDRSYLVVELKNISSKDSWASGTLKITQSGNMIFEKLLYKLPEVGAKSVTKFKIPFTVVSKAQSKELIMAKASLELPGDKYKAVREEVISHSQELGVNPRASLELSYDRSPRIKGVFSYYIHTLNVEVGPDVEDLQAGYEVSISVDDNQKDLMEFKVSKLRTKILDLDEKQKLDFSYVFKKAAKHKTIGLKLQVMYKGRPVKEKTIELQPH